MSEEKKKCPRCNSEMEFKEEIWDCPNCEYYEYFVCFNCPKSEEPHLIFTGSDGEGTYRYDCRKCGHIILQCTGTMKKSKNTSEKRICIGSDSHE